MALQKIPLKKNWSLLSILTAPFFMKDILELKPLSENALELKPHLKNELRLKLIL